MQLLQIPLENWNARKHLLEQELKNKKQLIDNSKDMPTIQGAYLLDAFLLNSQLELVKEAIQKIVKI